MALAVVAYSLWKNNLRFDPESPIGPNRDRFVLSPGHASMLLYARRHLQRNLGAGLEALRQQIEKAVA
jgi:transketolase